MAKLLDRLGRFSAKRAWVVLTTWLVLLVLAGGGFAIGFKGLVDSFDVPDTASGDIIAELEEKLPEFSGASGTVVFHTASGEAFTPAQEAQISELVEAMQDLPDVANSVDPFSTEQMRAAQAGLIEAAEGSAMTPEQSHQLKVGK